MTKELFEAQIINNIEISGGIYRVTLSCGEHLKEAEPGQFVNVYLNNKSMLLPRPLSICRTEKDRLALVYRVAGSGTKELSGYRSGETLRVSAPLGQGYHIHQILKTLDEAGPGKKTIAIVAGGLGVPPMVELSKTIRKRLPEVKLIAALGFQEETFLTEELANYCDEIHIAVEIGRSGFRGNVLEMMEAKDIKADYYLSCGPKPMLKALAFYCEKASKPLQVSMEERMGCGYGACVGCTCKTTEPDGTIRQKKVCKDGPVFFGSEVIWNE